MSKNHGWLCGWENFRNKKLHKDYITQVLEKYNLPTEVVHDLTHKAALTRAFAQMKENRQIDKIKNQGGEYQFQLTRRFIQDEKLEFDFETIVTLHADTGRIECSDPAVKQQAELLLQDAMDHRTPQDITKMVHKVLQTQAKMWPFLVEKGCVYMVPEAYDDLLGRVEKFVTDMGGTFRRSPVPRGDDYGNQTARESYSAYMHGLLKKLRDVVDGFDATTRSETMFNVAKQYQEVSFEAQAFAEYTNHTITTAIEEAKAALIAKAKEVEELKKEEKAKLAQAS